MKISLVKGRNLSCRRGDLNRMGDDMGDDMGDRIEDGLGAEMDDQTDDDQSDEMANDESYLFGGDELTEGELIEDGSLNTVHGGEGTSTISCASVRRWMLVDDPIDPIAQANVELHRAGCLPCDAFGNSVAELGRRAEALRVPADSAFVEAVMERADTVRGGRRAWVRPALAWCAVVVAAQSLGPLIFGDAAGASTHVARHVGATSFALAFGFAMVAKNPRRAGGLLPLVAALCVAMVAASVVDLADGTAGGLGELFHVPELAGLGLLWLAAGSPRPDRLSGWVTGRAGAQPTS